MSFLVVTAEVPLLLGDGMQRPPLTASNRSQPFRKASRVGIEPSTVSQCFPSIRRTSSSQSVGPRSAFSAPPPPPSMFMGVDVKIGVGLSEQFAPENSPASLCILPKPKLFKRHILGHSAHVVRRAKTHQRPTRAPLCRPLFDTAATQRVDKKAAAGDGKQARSGPCLHGRPEKLEAVWVFFFCHCYDSRWKFSL